MIVVYKRKWWGRLKRVGTYKASRFDIVVSTDGVLTIRDKHDLRTSVAAFAKGEWSVCLNLELTV